MMDSYQQRLRQMIQGFGTWYEDQAVLESGRMTNKLHPYTSIFSPIRVNSITIKNRLVMGPMGNISMAEETGRPSAKMVQYFTERARGGVGLITSGLVPISHGIDPTVTEMDNLSYFPRIDRSRTNFSAWRDIAERCHGYGARFFIQLTPGLGRVGSPECLLNKKKLPVSGSWNPNFYLPAIPCKPLSSRAAWKIIRRAGQAAADAKAATIDGVYLHGHEGYLLEQMTNKAFNRRKIGKFADVQAFGVEMVKEMRKRVGPDYPIMYRIDLSLALNETYGERMSSVKSLKKFRDERGIGETLEYMEALVAAGVDLFDVDLGCYDNWWLPHPPAPMPPGCFLEIARMAKDHFASRGIKSNKGLDVPIVAVGKLGYPDLAEKALREDYCDMIMLARPLLADPEWPKKAYAGRVDEIRPCIGDQEGCINEFVEGGHPQCAVNPRSGFEEVFDGREMAPALDQKKVAVVGAGPAGILTSLVAAQRGHSVVLFEKEKEIGGMLVPGSRPHIKFDVLNYLKYLRGRIERARLHMNLTVKTGTTVTPEELKKDGYDVIVCATGTVQSALPVKGIERPHVVRAVDLLKDPSSAGEARNIVIIGGGEVGCETAYMCRHEMGREVKVVEMLPHFMEGVCTANRGYLLHYLQDLGVDLINCAVLKEIRDSECIIEKNISKTVPDPYVTWSPLLPENIDNPFEKKIRPQLQEEALKADLVVLAVGGKPNEQFFLECQKIGAAKEMYNIGDSFSCGRVFEATKSAYQAAISI